MYFTSPYAVGLQISMTPINSGLLLQSCILKTEKYIYTLTHFVLDLVSELIATFHLTLCRSNILDFCQRCMHLQTLQFAVEVILTDQHLLYSRLKHKTVNLQRRLYNLYKMRQTIVYCLHVS